MFDQNHYLLLTRLPLFLRTLSSGAGTPQTYMLQTITEYESGVGLRRVFTTNVRKVSKIEPVLNHLEPCNVKKNEDLRLKPPSPGIY